MTRRQVLLLTIVLLIIGVAIYQYEAVPRIPVHDRSIDEKNLHDESFEPPVARSVPTTETEEISQPGKQAPDSESCLTLEQLESHPILVEDAYRFDSVATKGPTIAAYRGLSAAELRGLASQGDSAAMAVLGAMSILRAKKLPENKAVPYLMHEETGLQTSQLARPPDSVTAAHLEEASEWFYQSALHGRVLALHHVGDLLWMQKGGPVELGWIDKAEYDSLASFPKNALLPANVYNALAFEIAPELQSGPYGTMMSELMLRSELQQKIVKSLGDRFREDLHAAGLPPISVTASAAPPFEELKSLLCESVLKRLDDANSE